MNIAFIKRVMGYTYWRQQPKDTTYNTSVCAWMVGIMLENNKKKKKTF